jgi:hypothetical protein
MATDAYCRALKALPVKILDRTKFVVHSIDMAAYRVTLVKSKKSPISGDDDRHAR